MSDRTRRHAAILRIIQDHEIHSQNQLRQLLARDGFQVAQGTLSQDLQELGIAKMPGPHGTSYVVPASATDPSPTLQRLLPALFVQADGVDNLLVIRTLTGGAQPVAVAIDRESWQEVLGTVAGDDTILVILRAKSHLDTVRRRLESLAGLD